MRIEAKFKASISAACSLVGVFFRILDRKRGVEGYVLDTDFSGCPREIAANALHMLTDGSGDLYDKAILIGIVDFLDDVVGPPKEDPDRTMRMEALADVLRTSRAEKEFHKWAVSWYD